MRVANILGSVRTKNSFRSGRLILLYCIMCPCISDFMWNVCTRILTTENKFKIFNGPKYKFGQHAIKNNMHNIIYPSNQSQPDHKQIYKYRLFPHQLDHIKHSFALHTFMIRITAFSIVCHCPERHRRSIVCNDARDR